jgi:acetyl-CoA carboxylase beta subunit/acetyl-CoA carboxylase alpha subunit
VKPALDAIFDPGTFSIHDDGLRSRDPLVWPGYNDALHHARERSGADESVTAGSGTIGGHRVEAAFFDFSFFGGSMGEVAGERLATALERAASRSVPLVVRTETGGARLQEGMPALIQMPKTVVARAALSAAHQPLIVVLGNPTTGGVLASIASLGDLTVIESDATVGFAGPRVAERFTGTLIEGRSHSATTAFNHGLVDELVTNEDLRSYLAGVLGVLAADRPQPVEAPVAPPADKPVDAWDAVQSARSLERPTGDSLLMEIGDGVVMLRGDRAGRDDPAISSGITRVAGRRMLFIGLNRDHAPGPAAYRKARRCISIAGRLGIPIITLVDTRGADPSSESENQGIASQIALTFESILNAPVPTTAVVIGEGGSGGALAFAATDVVLAYADSIFSVIGPEGAAEILWRDAGRATDAARLLHLTAHDLLEFGIADELLAGPPTPASLAEAVAYHLDRIETVNPSQLLEKRAARWRGRG